MQKRLDSLAKKGPPSELPLNRVKVTLPVADLFGPSHVRSGPVPFDISIVTFFLRLFLPIESGRNNINFIYYSARAATSTSSG